MKDMPRPCQNGNELGGSKAKPLLKSKALRLCALPGNALNATACR
jgi:hypothetical protein